MDETISGVLSTKQDELEQLGAVVTKKTDVVGSLSTKIAALEAEVAEIKSSSKQLGELRKTAKKSYEVGDRDRRLALKVASFQHCVYPVFKAVYINKFSTRRYYCDARING